MLPPLLRRLEPASVVDVGSGVGAWALTAIESGITDVVAIDGAYVARTELLIPSDQFVAIDLSASFSLQRRFDLAICMEVAEHLPPSRASSFISDLCRLADVVLFSAAIPGQGGVEHVNLRWPSYWAEAFSRQGFGVEDIRPRFWRDQRIAWWYRQNAMLATRDGTGTGGFLDCVHPELWEGALAPIGVRRAFRLLAGALGRRFRQPERRESR
jgi:hypothetical protein